MSYHERQHDQQVPSESTTAVYPSESHPVESLANSFYASLNRLALQSRKITGKPEDVLNPDIRAGVIDNLRFYYPQKIRRGHAGTLPTSLLTLVGNLGHDIQAKTPVEISYQFGIEQGESLEQYHAFKATWETSYSSDIAGVRLEPDLDIPIDNDLRQRNEQTGEREYPPHELFNIQLLNTRGLPIDLYKPVSEEEDDLEAAKNKYCLVLLQPATTHMQWLMDFTKCFDNRVYH